MRTWWLILLVLAGCKRDETVSLVYPYPRGYPLIAFGAPRLAILEQATSASAFRLDNESDPEQLVRTRPRDARVALDAGQRARLADAILGANHLRAFTKMCFAKPGVEISVARGADRVEVLLCFDCGALAVVTHGYRGGQDFAPREWLEFAPVWHELEELVKELFPNDPEIQALRVDRPRT
jgi:hypothetical protein